MMGLGALGVEVGGVGAAAQAERVTTMTIKNVLERRHLDSQFTGSYAERLMQHAVGPACGCQFSAITIYGL